MGAFTKPVHHQNPAKKKNPSRPHESTTPTLFSTTKAHLSVDTARFICLTSLYQTRMFICKKAQPLHPVAKSSFVILLLVSVFVGLVVVYRRRSLCWFCPIYTVFFPNCCLSGKLGLSTCYDVRFPEMYTKLVERGAQIILVPSAFTVPTGKAHWHILLQSECFFGISWCCVCRQLRKREKSDCSHCVL